MLNEKVYKYVLFAQVRLPADITDDVDEDPTGNKALWDRGLLNGASQKVTNEWEILYRVSVRKPKCIDRKAALVKKS